MQKAKTKGFFKIFATIPVTLNLLKLCASLVSVSVLELSYLSTVSEISEGSFVAIVEASNEAISTSELNRSRSIRLIASGFAE
jgi:hypothetical protein